MLNIYAISKARIIEALDPVAPLCRVRAVEMHERKLLEENLDIA